jgi:hypothetical protein
MKITPTDRADLAAAIAPLDTPKRRAAYLAGDFPRAEMVKNLDMRYRWDLLSEAMNGFRRQMALGESGRERDVYDRIYTYADDTHLDTALRSIVPALVPAN